VLIFYLKRLVVIALIIGAGVGYSLWEESRETAASARAGKYASAVAQLAVAEALHHDSDNQGDKQVADSAVSWQEIKDSLLSEWNLTSDSVENYVNSFEGREEKLSAFWKQVRINVDSLTKLELARLSPPIDSLTSDSLTSDSLIPDSLTTDRLSEEVGADSAKIE
jgi:hypothetical protein